MTPPAHQLHVQQPERPRRDRPPVTGPRWFHESMPGYDRTEVFHLPEVATSIGVADVMVKDEQQRLGLPSFKILGGSWAIHRLLSSLAGEPVLGRSFADLEQVAGNLAPRTLVAATDGNHGRGVAHMARLLGLAAVIIVPDDMVAARIAGIRSEGAEVIVNDGDYDAAVARASELGRSSDRFHTVADVATEEHDEVPQWVMEGYDTIFDEVVEQAPEAPTALVVQAGVGALAGAAAAYFEVHHPGLRVGVVEPLTAACLMKSARAGRPVSLASSQGSMMAGLNCGSPSSVAWPVIARRTSAFLAVDDHEAGEAMRRLAAQGIVAGESGAAGLAGLLVAARDPVARDALGLDPEARVLLLNTEGATDPANYRAVVGRSAEEVAAGAALVD